MQAVAEAAAAKRMRLPGTKTDRRDERDLRLLYRMNASFMGLAIQAAGGETAKMAARVAAVS